MNPVHPADAHRAPQPERRTPTPRTGGQARHGHGRGPGDEPDAHATGDRAPDDPSPGNNPRRPPGGRIPAGPDHARCRPPASSRARRRRRPGAAGPAGPEDPAPARSVPARPRGRRATGPAATTIADHAEREASTPLRAGPARTRRQPWARSDPSRNPTMMAAGSSPRRVVEDPGRFRRAQQPDPDASTHRRTDRTGRSPPPRRMRRCSALTRTPGRRRPPLLPGTRSPCGPPGALPSDVRSRRALPRSRHQRRGRGAPPSSCDPVPDRLRHRTVRSGHPGHRPGPPDDPENDPPPEPRTASRHRHDPTPPRSLPPTARKTPNTPVRRASSRRRAALPRDGRARNAARTPRSRGRHATAGLWLT